MTEAATYGRSTPIVFESSGTSHLGFPDAEAPGLSCRSSDCDRCRAENRGDGEYIRLSPVRGSIPAGSYVDDQRFGLCSHRSSRLVIDHHVIRVLNILF